ncbi:MAG: FprA family A-type flavoprotein [Ignisphaera sp.]
MYRAIPIVNNVYWVGARDISRRLFDSLIPLPRGTSYNSYLVVGTEKIVLIDTVNPGFENELVERISSVVEPSKLDYVVMNHAEPDHAGVIPYILNLSPKAKLITTAIGAKMARIFYGVADERIIIVRDDETIDLGGKSLRFIEAPMLHWPETMFTYLVEDGVLFPCDFFGAHVAQGLWDDEVEDLIYHAQRYFGEIMMPFKNNALNALKKIADLDIKIIAPSHGPIYRNPRKIIENYYRWARGETREKATILYVSMWHYTEKIVKMFADELKSNEIEVVLHDLAVADVGDVAKDLVDSRAIVVATPTVVLNAHPLTVQAAYLTKLLKPPTKYLAIITLYAWGTAADRQLEEMLSDLKAELVGVVKINVTPSKEDVENLRSLAKELSKKIRDVASK